MRFLSGFPLPPDARHLPRVTVPADRVGRDELERALQRALEKIRRNMGPWRGRFPASASIAGRYPVYRQEELTNGDAWTSGFWPGLLWLAYEASGDVSFQVKALSYVDLFADRIRRRIWVDNHDLGFLYTLSCVAAFRLNGSEQAREAALRAAVILADRYQPKGGFIQAWGPVGDPVSYRLIVDCLMNIPLLFWATETSGDPHYRDIAVEHLNTTLDHILRPDNSTFHTFFFDPATGRPLRGETRQGFSDGSCWARGQAWAIYGIALAMRQVRDEALVGYFTCVTDYFLRHLPPDNVCYWDLSFQSGPEERDSSAAAIAVCGLLQALPYLPAGVRRDQYERAAHEIMRGLLAHCVSGDGEDGLLSHGVYSKPHGVGVDECCIWGDYFFLEALVRLQKRWTPYW